MFGGALAILVLAEIVIRQTLRVAHHFRLSGTFEYVHVVASCITTFQIKP